MKSLLSDNFFTSIAFVIIIIAVVVVIAVALILYFMVFKKKIDANLAERKVNKEQKAAANEKSKNLTNKVFDEREAEEADTGPTKEELEAKDKQVQEVIKRTQSNSLYANTKTANAKGSKTKTAKPKDDAGDKGGSSDGYSVMNQFNKKG